MAAARADTDRELHASRRRTLALPYLLSAIVPELKLLLITFVNRPGVKASPNSFVNRPVAKASLNNITLLFVPN